MSLPQPQTLRVSISSTWWLRRAPTHNCCAITHKSLFQTTRPFIWCVLTVWSGCFPRTLADPGRLWPVGSETSWAGLARRPTAQYLMGWLCNATSAGITRNKRPLGWIETICCGLLFAKHYVSLRNFSSRPLMELRNTTSLTKSGTQCPWKLPVNSQVLRINCKHLSSVRVLIITAGVHTVYLYLWSHYFERQPSCRGLCLVTSQERSLERIESQRSGTVAEWHREE